MSDLQGRMHERSMVARLLARIAGLVSRGTVRKVDDGPKLQVLRINLGGGDDCPGVERFQEYGFTSVPLAGSEALLVFPGGVPEHPVAVAVDDRNHRPVGLQPGDVAIYCSGGARVLLRAADGAVVVDAPGTFEVNAETVVLAAQSALEVKVGTQRMAISSAGIQLEAAAIDMDQVV